MGRPGAPSPAYPSSQQLPRFAQSQSAMAHPPLLRCLHLGEGLTRRWIQKNWIISEAPAAARRVRDDPFDPRLDRPNRHRRRRHRDRRHESGRAILNRHASQTFEDQCHTIRVTPSRSPIPCRVHPRLAIQSVDFQTGIIRDRQHAGCSHARLSLEDRVLAKGMPGLLNVQCQPEISRTNHRILITQDVLKFLQFVRIVRSEENLSSHD